MSDPVTGAINHARLLINAIAEGRIEAKTLQDMTDEQLSDYIVRLQGELESEVAEGYAMHETDGSPE